MYCLHGSQNDVFFTTPPHPDSFSKNAVIHYLSCLDGSSECTVWMVLNCGFLLPNMIHYLYCLDGRELWYIWYSILFKKTHTYVLFGWKRIILVFFFKNEP